MNVRRRQAVQQREQSSQSLVKGFHLSRLCTGAGRHPFGPAMVAAFEHFHGLETEWTAPLVQPFEQLLEMGFHAEWPRFVHDLQPQAELDDTDRTPATMRISGASVNADELTEFAARLKTWSPRLRRVHTDAVGTTSSNAPPSHPGSALALGPGRDTPPGTQPRRRAGACERRSSGIVPPPYLLADDPASVKPASQAPGPARSASADAPARLSRAKERRSPGPTDSVRTHRPGRQHPVAACRKPPGATAATLQEIGSMDGQSMRGAMDWSSRSRGWRGHGEGWRARAASLVDARATFLAIQSATGAGLPRLDHRSPGVGENRDPAQRAPVRAIAATAAEPGPLPSRRHSG